ncbi:MAG: phosphoribosylformylglycinamidine synthase subunit PurQ [Rhodospirillales bacterium]|nr:phosphoribosylformylglycinamidine synthase subunit PurQ [Rhodospirillales bacterium]
MKAAVIVFPGSNCDRDMKVALANSMGSDPLMVWHGDSNFPEVDLIVLPGGFSYGDYLRSGAMSANSPVMQEIVRRANKGIHVLGVCNGFQILTEAGLLPGVLMRNSDMKFVCKDVSLRVEAVHTPFTQGYDKGQIINVPVAHHDGNYFIDDDGFKELEDNRMIGFRYAHATGQVDEKSNINGSRDNIAGVFNKGRNVMGMMPHPERLIDPALGGVDGKPMFDSLVEVLS